MKKLNFNKTIYILLTVLLVGIVIFAIIADRAARQELIDRTRQNILEGEEIVTVPLTPRQYLDAVEGLEGEEVDPFPSGYLLRRWEVDPEAIKERNEAIGDPNDY